MNKKEVFQLISKYNLKVKKKFGQNFLIDDNILTKIAGAIPNSSELNVIEIGPGLGSLTIKLLEKFKRVLSYEIDEDMVEILSDEINNPNFHLVNQDFLKSNVEHDIIQHFESGQVVLIANLPYYITTPILIKIIEEVPSIKQMVVMMQKEVAERICGNPSTKDYNNLSVLIQYFTNTKKLFNVYPTSFYPEPEVDSSVVYIERKEKIDFPASNLTFFLKFIRVIFAQRRKTLINNLTRGLPLTKQKAEEALKELEFQENVRAESLSVNEIVRLANLIFIKLNH